MRALCAPHTGVGADGILLLSETDERGFVAEVRIYNPDGSEAELSGNGVREAVMYLRRHGWTDLDSFSVRTAAGEIRPRMTGPDTCTVDMGRARLSSPEDFPSGGEDGTGTLTAATASSLSSSSRSATRSARSRSPTGSRSSTCSATVP